MPLAELLELSKHFALHFDSNPRNIEHHWYGPWNEILTDARNKNGPSLMIYPQYMLTQSGITRAQSVSLGIDSNAQSPLDSDTEMSDDELPSLEINVERDSSYEDNGSMLDLFYEIATRSKSSGAACARDSTDDYALPAPPSTPEYLAGGSKEAVLSSGGTRALDKNSDSSFIVDYAVLKIVQAGPASARFTIFGSSVPQTEAYVPIILESKVFPRKTPLLTPERELEHSLSQALVKGYRDTNSKAPAAPRSHRMQRSTLGIATCGLWWSFTVITSGTRKTTWSKAFMYGTPDHDLIFKALFQAASGHPGDPLEFQGGQVQELLMRWKREAYDQYDVLAALNP
ncbi:hypothetical protein FRC06_009414 [Ceratobasidium sp. 370]|nr:hypothetical protein FRC06_009414 [Ceratobasidium sp. 370]